MSNKMNKIFFENPTKYYSVREIAKILDISPTTASKKLKNLKEKKILKYKKEKIYDLYKSNLDSSIYTDYKIFYNIRNLKESGLVDDLNKFYLKPTIILFGSSARGIDTENSDIDLIVISENTSTFDKLKKYEKKLKKEIQIFNIEKISDLKNENLINNVINGIVIQGEFKWI